MSNNKKTLAELRANFNPVKTETFERGPNNYFSFKNMPAGSRAVVRFLPDLDDNNPHGFLVEKMFHSLAINGEEKTIPCPKQYDKSNECAICNLSRDYYKVNDKVNGKKYYRKLQHVAQALMIEDPTPADAATGETGQGKIRYINLGFQIYTIIKEAFANDDEPLEGIPYDMEDGYDFIIKKTQQPGADYPSYTVGTKFMSRQRPLDDEEQAYAQENMIDLSTLLPKQVESDKIAAMLEAHLNGVSFNDSADQDDSDQIDFKEAPKKTAPAKSAEVADESDEDVDEMLAAIKARRQQK